jgi:hypothetical protein
MVLNAVALDPASILGHFDFLFLPSFARNSSHSIVFLDLNHWRLPSITNPSEKSSSLKIVAANSKTIQIRRAAALFSEVE